MQFPLFALRPRVALATKRSDMQSVLPDRPVGVHDEDDLLGRREFAENLTALIINSPKGSTLRLGVYGGWGEGKTSVLQMMRRKLKDAGHACVWIVPWMAETKDDIVTQITRELAQELNIDLNELKDAEKSAAFIKRFRELGNVDIRAKAADVVLGSALEKYFGGAPLERAAEALSAKIEEQLQDKKLIVFVDDLDRVRPDLVPTLLLTLREALDRPDYYYVLALAPEIVERGLAAVHAAWGEPRQFLEKIVELPRYLPRTREEDRKRYINELIRVAGAKIETDALHGLITYLPENPRRIKLFIRYIASFGNLLERFGTGEFSIRVLYLAQLLKTEFPKEVQALIDDPDTLTHLQLGWLLDTVGPRGGGPSDRDASKERPEHRHISAGHPERERFIRICEALRENGAIDWGRYGLGTLLAMPDTMPAVTTLEIDQLANAWLATGNATERSRQLSADIMKLAGQSPTMKMMRAIWTVMLEVREGHLRSVVSKELESEFLTGLEDAASLLFMVKDVWDGPFGISAGLLDVEQWRELFSHVSNWAHVTRFDAHGKLRAQEWEVLRSTFMQLSSSEKATLHMRLSRINRVDPTPGIGFVDLVQSLHHDALRCAVEEVLNRFSVVDGLDVMGGGPENDAVRMLLFSPASPLYSEPEYLAQMRTIADTAGAEPTVQMNFLKFFHLLAYAVTERGIGSLSSSECRTLVSNTELMSTVWRASVAQPLNPSAAANLRGYRDMIGTELGTFDTMPLPQWWRRLEESGVFRPTDATSQG